MIFRNRLILKWVKDVPHKSNKDARRHLRKTLNRIGFGDWLLLYMIARNIDRYLYLCIWFLTHKDFHKSFQRSLHCTCQLHPSSRVWILPRRGAESGRRKSDQLMRHSPFLAGTLIVLDASSFFFPSTFNPFLRSSLKDMLHVPQRNLEDR